MIKDKVLGRIPLLRERELAAVAIDDSHVTLTLSKKDGLHETLRVDHTIAATGIRVDLRRLTLLSPSSRKEIGEYRGTPIFRRNFESSVPGLYFIGLAAAASFGPLMRFTFGARYATHRLTRGVVRSQRTSARNFARATPDRHAGTPSNADRSCGDRLALLNAVRLCRAFREVGFEVAAIALPQHPVHRSKAPLRTFEYRPKAPLESLREAIAEQRPDIIIPCDDRIVGHVCALQAVGDDKLRL